MISRMNGELARLSRRLLLPLVFGFATTDPTALPPGGDTHLLRALAVIESDHADLCPAMASQEEFEATLANLADETRAGLASGPSGPASVEAVKRMIFGQLEIRASADLKDPCNLLPSRVLERKQSARSLAEISALAALPSVEAFKDFDVVARLDQARSAADVELLEALR